MAKNKIIYIPIEELPARYTQMMNAAIYPKVDISLYPKVEIDKEAEKIRLMGHNYELSEVLASLNSMGYPQKGENTLFKQAKSYVSCAIGKMS